MYVAKWSLFWIMISIVATGLANTMINHFDVPTWVYYIRSLGGVFFMVSLIVGGVLTTRAAFHNRKRKFYNEDWSLICIIVTISLFGISWLL